jgi:hypothetical protein
MIFATFTTWQVLSEGKELIGHGSVMTRTPCTMICESSMDITSWQLLKNNEIFSILAKMLGSVAQTEHVYLSDTCF